MSRNLKNNNNKNRLGKFSSSFGIDENIILSQDNNPINIKKWLSSIISCGSNAFGQIYHSDVMCSIPQLTQLPGCSQETDNTTLLPITHIAVGTNLTIACIERKKVYIWGSGIGSQLRIPTLLKFPEKLIVEKISCGESHAALIATTGKVYTWGNGEHGALGHGNKQTQSIPKVVNALINLKCVSISCGPYHTAFIAGEENEISYVRIPSLSSSSTPIISPNKLSLYQQDNNIDNNEDDNNNDNESMTNHNVLICASLYTCGLGKAGQLGHGQSIAMMRTPQIVNWFNDNGYKVAQVSCGMHHTVVLSIPIHAIRVFTTNIFTFGWGEHGRLGLGNEEGSLFPSMVQFSEPFHAVHISAGEQHTIATSGRIGGCYAWGNNEFGQCGIGTQSTNDMILLPTKVALPEGVRAVKVFGGGRHTAALSSDNQILFWGWGEEGQLGNGSEKDSIIPKPYRIPTIMGIQPSSMNIIDIGLGMSHSVVLVQNLEYRPIILEKPKEQKKEEKIEQKLEEIESKPETQNIPKNEIVDEIPIENLKITPPDPPKEPIIIERVPITPVDIVKKEAIMVVHEVQEPPPVLTPIPIRSLKDILNAREERREGKITELVSVLEPYIPPSSSPSFSSLPIKPKSPEIVITTNENEINIIDQNLKETNIENEIEEDLMNNTEINEQGNQPKRRGSGNTNMQQYFYREGQDLTQCYVANSAKRAEIRKIRKASQQYSDSKPNDNKLNKNTNKVNK